MLLEQKEKKKKKTLHSFYYPPLYMMLDVLCLHQGHMNRLNQSHKRNTQGSELSPSAPLSCIVSANPDWFIIPLGPNS